MSGASSTWKWKRHLSGYYLLMVKIDENSWHRCVGVVDDFGNLVIVG
jgi:hypothetical protein